MVYTPKSSTYRNRNRFAFGNDVDHPYWEYEKDSDHSSSNLHSTSLDPQVEYLLRMFGLIPPSAHDLDASDIGKSQSLTSFSSREDTDLDGKVSISDLGTLFNKPKEGKLNFVANPDRSVFRQFGMSQSTKVVTLPDGTVQMETVTKDGKGNVERKVTYTKAGKSYTVITKVDPSGKEKVEERVNADDNEVIPGINTWSMYGDFGSNTLKPDNGGYDYWFNKFFEKEKPPDTFPSNSLGLPTEVEKQIETILKSFGIDPFSATNNVIKRFGKNSKENNRGVLSDDFFKDGNTIEDNDAFIEARKFVESSDKGFKIVPEKHNKRRYSRKKDKDPLDVHRQMQEKMSKALEDIVTSQSPSLFKKLESRAMNYLLDEPTPFDKLIKPDEEKVNQLKQIWKETGEHLNNLQKYFDSAIEGKDNNRNNIDLLLPSAASVQPFVADKQFSLDKKLSDSDIQVSKSEIRYPDGKIKSVIVKTDKDGCKERTVTYKVGDKSYTIITSTDKSGLQHTQKNTVNIDEDDVKKFSQLWDEKDSSDFKE